MDVNAVSEEENNPDKNNRKTKKTDCQINDSIPPGSGSTYLPPSYF